MLRFAADENLNNHILRALARHERAPDTVRVQDVGLSGAADAEVLEWAAREGRLLLTHDLATMPRWALARVREGKAMPGVVLIPREAPHGTIVADLLLLADTSHEGEWKGQLLYLPL